MTPQEGHTYLLTLESWSPFKTLKKKRKKKERKQHLIRRGGRGGTTCTQNLDIVSKYSQVSADVTTHTWELRHGAKDRRAGTQR